MISIVMPTHCKMPLLYATLVSVFSQNYNDYEFVVVDASEDSYFEKEAMSLFENYTILHKYCSKINKMKIIRPDSNWKFPGAMKMTGFKSCVQDDDFVVFLDHDDFLGSDLLYHMKHAKIQYPDTEMLTSKYTSMIYYDNGKLTTNAVSYAGGDPCESSDTIYIGDIYFKFEANQDIYKNNHPYKAAMCPKILSKKLLREKRFTFIEDTNRMDDFLWPVLTHSFIETYMPIIGYVYVAYSMNTPTNSCDNNIRISDKAENLLAKCNGYAEMLNEIGYVKRRNTYIL